MSFDSLSFWVIFAFVLPLYWQLGLAGQNALLLALSVFLYSFWGWGFFAVLLGVSVLNFLACLWLERAASERAKRGIFWLTISLSLAPLFSFKYLLASDAFVGVLREQFPTLWTMAQWGVPVGISFYTFQILSYTIDVSAGRIRASRSFANFFLFVIFFPQLVAGPIERARSLLPQLERERKWTYENAEFGFFLCLWGLFKKMYVANGLLHAVQSFHSQTQVLEAGAVLTVAAFSTFMVYADFSGYSDMARGLGKLLGVELTINFKPFWKSKNPSEFWQTWNVSLTRWLRDYVFLPVRRKGEGGKEISPLAIFLIMTMVGLWHAGKLNWLLFGMFNGALVVVYNLCKKRSWAPVLVGTVTLILLHVGNGLLHSTADGASLVRQMQGLKDWTSWSATLDLWRYGAWFLLPLFVLESLFPLQVPTVPKWISSYSARYAMLVICMVGILFLERSTSVGFIYFQF